MRRVRINISAASASKVRIVNAENIKFSAVPVHDRQTENFPVVLTTVRLAQARLNYSVRTYVLKQPIMRLSHNSDCALERYSTCCIVLRACTPSWSQRTATSSSPLLTVRYGMASFGRLALTRMLTIKLHSRGILTGLERSERDLLLREVDLPPRDPNFLTYMQKHRFLTRYSMDALL